MTARNRAGKLAVILGVLLAAGSLYVYIVLYFGIGIRCPFEAITGLQCPGCGVSTMCLAILRFDFKSAFYANPVTFCVLPFILYLIGYSGYRYVKYGDQKIPVRLEICIIILIAAYIIFGVLRNLI